jgi:hypothetical protein
MRFKKAKSKVQRAKSHKETSGIFFGIKSFTGVVFLLLLFALCSSLFIPCPMLYAETIRDRVVAYIDNTAITLSDLEEKYAETVKVLPDTSKEEVLNTMINRMLLIKEADRIKMEAPSEEELLKEYIDLKLRTFIRIRDEDLLDYYNKHSDAFEGKAFDSVRDEIERYLVESELNTRLKLHIAELREKACISIRFHKDE